MIVTLKRLLGCCACNQVQHRAAASRLRPPWKWDRELRSWGFHTSELKSAARSAPRPLAKTAKKEREHKSPQQPTNGGRTSATTLALPDRKPGTSTCTKHPDCVRCARHPGLCRLAGQSVSAIPASASAPAETREQSKPRSPSKLGGSCKRSLQAPCVAAGRDADSADSGARDDVVAQDEGSQECPARLLPPYERPGEFGAGHERCGRDGRRYKVVQGMSVGRFEWQLTCAPSLIPFYPQCVVIC